MILNPLGRHTLLSPISPNQYMPRLLSSSIYTSYNTYLSPLIIPPPINPLHAYTRPYKLISLYKYIPIYHNPYAFVVGPPRGTVGVITRYAPLPLYPNLR